jgi:maltooligosyltrehalose trehalohydrolase
LRREDGVFGARRARVEGAVLADEAFVLRFFGARAGDDRLLLVNLGAGLNLSPAPEPLLAPHEDKLWKVLWSSEDPLYGGCGTPPLDGPDNWSIPGQAAVAMRPADEDRSWS